MQPLSASAAEAVLHAVLPELETTMGCPEELWLPPPWHGSRPGWMEL